MTEIGVDVVLVSVMITVAGDGVAEVSGERSRIWMLLSPLFATNARLRRLSMATPVGDFPTGVAGSCGLPCEVERAFKLNAESVLEPVLATNAIPVTGFTAMLLGWEPAP